MPLLLLALAICSLTSCIAVTPDEPEVYYSPDRLARMTLTVLKVDATLEDSNGIGVPGVFVSVETPHYRETSTTTGRGYFFAWAKFAEDEGIDFHFTSKDIDWTETLTTIPEGAEQITLRFLLEKNKTVRLTAIEYKS
jgi:hypothetical protein